MTTRLAMLDAEAKKAEGFTMAGILLAATLVAGAVSTFPFIAANEMEANRDNKITALTARFTKAAEAQKFASMIKMAAPAITEQLAAGASVIQIDAKPLYEKFAAAQPGDTPAALAKQQYESDLLDARKAMVYMPTITITLALLTAASGWSALRNAREYKNMKEEAPQLA